MLLQGAVSILPKTRDIIVGDSIEGDIVIDALQFVQGDSVQLNLAFGLETYQGVVMRTLKSTQERILVKGERITVPWVLDGSTYLQQDLSNVFVTIVAVGWTSDNKSFFAKDVFDIDSPAVTISMPADIAIGSTQVLPVKAAFTNPLDFRLKDVCVTIHSHDLRFEGMALHQTQLTRCVDLHAQETLEIQTQLLAPCKAGSCIVMATVVGDYLPTATSNAEVSSANPNDSKRSDPTLPYAVCATVAALLLLGTGVGYYFRARRHTARVWLGAEASTACVTREMQETA
jgi:hypothetical protein